jgi:hypothetical protein
LWMKCVATRRAPLCHLSGGPRARSSMTRMTQEHGAELPAILMNFQDS